MNSFDPHSIEAVLRQSLGSVDASLAVRDYEQALQRLQRCGDPAGWPESDQGLYWSRRAKIAFETREYTDARQYARRAIDLLLGTLEHEGLSYAQLVYGYTLTALGEMRESELAVRDAISNLRRAGLEDDLSEPYNALAQVYFLRSDYDRACEYLNEALHVARQAGREADARRVLGNLGRVLILSGRWEEAESALRDALAAQEELGRAIGIVRNLLSLGYLFVLQHRTTEVRSLWQRAAELIDEHEFILERVILLEYQGDLAIAEGRLEDGRDALTEALEIGNTLTSASSIQNQIYRRLADACCGLHAYEDAVRWAEQAAELSTRLGDRQEEGAALRALAVARAGLGQDYRDSFDRALSVLRGVGDPYELARAYLAYGTTLACSSDAALQTDALRLLDRAREMATDLGSDKIEAEVAMAQARARAGLGQFDSALAHLGPAEDILGERARTYRRELEERLVTEATSPRNEYLIFKTFAGEGDTRTGSLEGDLGKLARKLDADSACVVMIIEGRYTCAARFGPAQFDAPALGAVFEPLVAQEAESRPVLYTDLTAHVEFSEQLRTAGRDAHSVIAVPLHFADEIIGLVYLERRIPNRPFGRAALNLAVAFAEPLAFRLAEVRARDLVDEHQRLRDQLGAGSLFPTIITRNSDMLAMMAQVAQVKDAPITIALEGETGVGKDLLAKAIHYNSNRRKKRFVAVNCAALPETVLESELFGHMKGAFTGADREKPGLLEEAQGGTFFLDEIGDMPLAVQAKLLRVLEEKEVVRLGDTKPRKIDIRIIIASNRDLKDEMEQGHFRQDLFYRLCTLSFRMPPLRERREDIPLLIDHFLARHSPPHEDEQPVKVDPVAFQWLVEYDWPGNVRELENEIKKLVLLAGPRRVILPELLAQKLFRPDGQGTGAERSLGEKRGFSLYDFLELYEKKYIQQALAENNWVKKHAAKSLNIPESTLRLKMKQYELKPAPKEKK